MFSSFNFENLFKYYRYALSVENVMNSKVIDPDSPHNKTDKYKKAWKKFSQSNEKSFIFEDLPTVLVKRDYYQFASEVSFMEKLTNLRQKNFNRRPYIKPDKDKTDIENCNDFTSPDEPPYQLCIILNFGKKNQKDKSYFPLVVIFPEFTSKCGKSLTGEQRFERLREIIENGYIPSYDDDELEFWDSKFIVNPKIEEIANINKELYKKIYFSTQDPSSILHEAFKEDVVQNLVDNKLVLPGVYYGAISQNFNMGLNRFYNTVIKDGPNQTLLEFFNVHPAKIGGIVDGLTQLDDVITTNKMASSLLKHYGSFDTENSLMDSQRDAMACYLQDERKLIPVNGAPGTGKTSLLRAICGDYIVKQAMDTYSNYKKSGEIIFSTPIVCSSTNNQALYNITEGIEKGFKEALGKGILYERWIVAEYKPILLKSKEGEDAPDHEPKSDSIDLSKTIYAPVIKTRQDNYFVITKQKLNEVINHAADVESAEYYVKKFHECFGVNPSGKTLKEKIAFSADFLMEKIKRNAYFISSSYLDGSEFDELSRIEKNIVNLMSNQSIEKTKGLFLALKRMDTKTKEVLANFDSFESITKNNLDQKIKELASLNENATRSRDKLIEALKEASITKQKIASLLNLQENPHEDMNFDEQYSLALKESRETIEIEESAILAKKREEIIQDSSLFERAKYIIGVGHTHEKIAQIESSLHGIIEDRFDAQRDKVLDKIIQQMRDRVAKDIETLTQSYFDLENKLLDLKTQSEKLNFRIDACKEEISLIQRRRDKQLASNDAFLKQHGITDEKLKKEIQAIIDPLFMIQEYEHIKEEKKKHDTKERSENFYLSIHLIEALFFLDNCQFIDEESDESDICPACELDTFIRDSDTGKYKCSNCGAYFVKSTFEEVMEQTPRWFSHIFKKKKAVIQSSGSMYVVQINTQNKMTFVNIDKKERGVSELWHSILPIFPIVSMTCNGMGSIIGEKNQSGEVVTPKDLFEFMLIDEAGTITPSKMVVLSAAKRVMFFGDVKQLKPVYPYTVDFEDRVLERFFESQSDRNIVMDYYSCADNSNMISTEIELAGRSSNAMDVANQSSLFFMPYNNSRLGGDIWLKDHFRCRKSIIEISNSLTYFGEVLPQKKDKEWQHLYFVEVDGVKNQDNTNREEVKAIIEYTINNKMRLKEVLSKAKGIDREISDKEYYESIGIITPFANQHRMFENAISAYSERREAELHNITVGTVHKYQGSEREIIIFSTVYGKADAPRAKNFFFNRGGTDMINVSVTRAKEIFVCFGNREALGAAGTHSSIMLNEILSHESKFKNLNENNTDS